MKVLYKFSVLGLFLAASVGLAGVSLAGGHGGKAPKASPKEQKCINFWRTGKKSSFLAVNPVVAL